MNVTTIVFILAGAYVFLGGFFNWDWFMNSRKAGWIVRIVGRQGARVFYMLVGAVLITLGALAEAGRISLGSG